MKVTIDPWQEWKQKQEKKFSFHGELLPIYMTEILSYNGFYGSNKTCYQCVRYRTIDFQTGQSSKRFSTQCDLFKKKKAWNGKWPACGKFKEKEKCQS